MSPWAPAASLAVAVLLGVLAGALKDEVCGRLDRLPRAILGRARRRLPADVRDDLADEWAAELAAILAPAAGLPLTRMVVGVRYAAGLYRTAPAVAAELTGAPAPAMPRLARLYAGGVVGLAATLLATASFRGMAWGELAVLAPLFLVCDSVSTRIGPRSIRISTGCAAGLASAVLTGPAGAALVGCSAVVTWQRELAPAKRLFNGALFALCGYAAGTAFTGLGGTRAPVAITAAAVAPYLGALVVFVAANLLLLAGILLLSHEARARELLARTGYMAGGCLASGLLGLFLAATWQAL